MGEVTGRNVELLKGLLHQAERTACQILDGKAVVITIDSNELHVLNAVGTRVWQLADGRAIDEIVSVIEQEYDVARERAEGDVCQFAQQLLSMGAVCLQSPGGSRVV